MTDKKEGGRNVADYTTIKPDIYAAYTQLETGLNAYQDPRMLDDAKARLKLLARLRRALLPLSGKAKGSHNVDKEVADKAKELRRNIFENSYKENCKELEEVYYKISESMGEQGFLDTRVKRDNETALEEDALDNTDNKWKTSSIVQKSLKGAK